MTDPDTIALIKKELKKRLAEGDNRISKSMGFSSGFQNNQSVLVYWPSTGRTMEQNLEFVGMAYSQYGFVDYLRKRLSDGDVYAVIKNMNPPKLLLIKKSGV